LRSRLERGTALEQGFATRHRKEALTALVSVYGERPRATKEKPKEKTKEEILKESKAAWLAQEIMRWFNVTESDVPTFRIRKKLQGKRLVNTFYEITISCYISCCIS